MCNDIAIPPVQRYRKIIFLFTYFSNNLRSISTTDDHEICQQFGFYYFKNNFNGFITFRF